MSEIGDYSIQGTPTPTEEALVLAALERMLREEAERARPSRWKLAGRAASLRVGVTELRHRFGSETWGASRTLSWSGESTLDFHGRGDSR